MNAKMPLSSEQWLSKLLPKVVDVVLDGRDVVADGLEAVQSGCHLVGGRLSAGGGAAFPCGVNITRAGFLWSAAISVIGVSGGGVVWVEGCHWGLIGCCDGRDSIRGAAGGRPAAAVGVGWPAPAAGRRWPNTTTGRGITDWQLLSEILPRWRLNLKKKIKSEKVLARHICTKAVMARCK